MILKIYLKKHKFLIIVTFIIALFYKTLWLYQQFSRNNGAVNNNRVLMLFSVAPQKCPYSIGETIFNQSWLNRRQYASLKGFDLFFNRRQPDKRFTGLYNKISILYEVIVNESNKDRYDWIFWMDYDSLIYNMSFNIPFRRYRHYSFVSWGDWDRLVNYADGEKGLNSGVFFLRNNEWSRTFLELILAFGLEEGRVKEEEMNRTMFNYNRILYDQNAIVYLLYKNPKLRKQIFFEKQYYLNRGWMETLNESSPSPNQFIIHLCGCRFCFDPPKHDCINSWNKFFHISNQNYLIEAKKRKKEKNYF